MKPDLRDIENAFLRKEVQHRVRNNIQVISSLLRMQMHFLENHAAGDEIEAASLRVNAMGILYEQVYQKKQTGAIDISLYIKNLIKSITSDLNLDIKYELEAKAEYFPIETVMPIGLIINELFIKWNKDHTPEKEKPAFVFRIGPKDEKNYLLEVEWPNNYSFSISPQTNFSEELIKLMSLQLEGKIDTSNSFSLLFPYPIVYQDFNQKGMP